MPTAAAASGLERTSERARVGFGGGGEPAEEHRQQRAAGLEWETEQAGRGDVQPRGRADDPAAYEEEAADGDADGQGHECDLEPPRPERGQGDDEAQRRAGHHAKGQDQDGRHVGVQAELGHGESRQPYEAGVGQRQLAAPVDQDVEADGAHEDDGDQAQLVGRRLAGGEGQRDEGRAGRRPRQERDGDGDA